MGVYLAEGQGLVSSHVTTSVGSPIIRIFSFLFVWLVVVVDKKKVMGQWDGSVGEVKVPVAKLDDLSYRMRE